MKKTLISAIVVVVLILLGVLIFGDKDAGNIADVENEAAAIESELADVEELIANDELTEENATAAYEHIVEHLNTIEASVTTSQGVTLSDEEKQQLVDAFQKLAETMTNYSDVLNILEGTATVDTTETIAAQLQEVVVELENYIEEVAADEVSETATSSDEASDEEEEAPVMEDGTLDDEDETTTEY